MSKGYYGLSFPFRVGVKGGLAMSGTNYLESPHISESVEQILNTKVRERVMESIGCNLSTFIFEPTDESSVNLLKYEIVESLSEYESRISIESDGVDISVDDINSGVLNVSISYTIKDYTNATHTTTIKLGGENNEN